jgi:anhydro-N-acetylmuramic acid kinase
MADRTLRAAGLMIGTSLDGVDAAVVEFAHDLRGHRLLAHRTLPLRAADPARLRAIAAGATTTAAELSALGFALVDDHEQAVRACCADAGVAPLDLDWAAAHGVTLWHAPSERGGHGWQLLPGPALAARLGCAVVHDFRSADLALGGHGAPLAPVADRMLRGSNDEDRVVLNLGGIANLSALPAGAGTVRAADVGPANLPLDELVRRDDPTGPGFDRDGAIAATGRALPALVESILAEAWVRAPLPRSWGREEFGPAWVDTIESRTPEASLADRLASVIEAEARALAWLLDEGLGAWKGDDASTHLLLTGGGRHNPALVAALERALPAVVVDGIEVLGEDADAKEAVDFALLGGLCVQRRAAGAWTTTGARHDTVLGSIAPGPGDSHA